MLTAEPHGVAAAQSCVEKNIESDTFPRSDWPARFKPLDIGLCP